MSGGEALDRALAERLVALDEAGLRRVPRVVDPAAGGVVLCGNDYLGLATHPALRAASARAAEAEGTGSGASRLVSGTRPCHEALERRLAGWMDAPAALAFNSGYQANVGTLSALLTEDDTVFCDALNHASLIDGVRLGRASRVVYPHGDAGALRTVLRSAPRRGLRLVVTDAVFSMDGDVAPLGALLEVARAEGAAVMVDEAHAIGVLGPQGRGLSAAVPGGEAVAVRTGTCGKAMGSFGAFVVGSEALRDWLWNRARAFVYTTSLPPTVIAATGAAVPLVEDGALQARLWERIRTLEGLLTEAGLWRGAAQSPIFPIRVGEASQAVALSKRLDARGYFVQSIRPPTVPAGTSRLRVTASASQAPEELAGFVAALVGAMDELGLTRMAAGHG